MDAFVQSACSTARTLTISGMAAAPGAQRRLSGRRQAENAESMEIPGIKRAANIFIAKVGSQVSCWRTLRYGFWIRMCWLWLCAAVAVGA